MAQKILIAAVIKMLTALADLEGAFVEAYLFDDPMFKQELYQGTIQEVKETAFGPYVRFAAVSGPSHITGSKWIPLHKVKGLVPEMQKALAS